MFFSIHLIITTMKKVNRLSGCEVKYFYGKRFVKYHGCWLLDEVCGNVITVKNAGAGRIYGAHPVTR